MKRIQDLCNDKEDISLFSEPKSPEVVGEKDENFSDISLGEKKEIDISSKKEIFCDSKRGKSFDALERRSIFSAFRYPKTLSIKKKESISLVQLGYIKARRKVRSFGPAEWILTCIIGVLIFIFLGFLDKIIVENRVNSGYQRLVEIRNGNLSIDEIYKEVNDARFDLLLSDVLFTPFKVFPGEKIESVNHVISAGRHLSKALDSTLFLYTQIDSFVAERSLQRIYFTQLFTNIYPVVTSIESSLKKSRDHYMAINWLPDNNLFAQREEVVKHIDSFLSYLSTISENYDTFLNIFGHDRKKRYLVVFQNADEIRPTGGFMGSMGLLEIYKGRVQLFQKKDVYEIEWNLKKADYDRLPAPKGIEELTDTFGLRDANYYANVRDSSESIKFFTDRAGIELDGIIYINQNILLRFLERTGPVYFDLIEREVTHENFSEIMSLLVEAKVFKKGTLGTPKQILFDFMEVFAQKLIEDGNYFDYLSIILHELESRDVIMWSFNESENALLTQLGSNGKINYSETLDFVYPVFTSLSGNKSDRYMKRSYDVIINSIADSCNYDVAFTLKSTHDMGKRKRENIEALIDEYNLTTPNLLQIQGADRNRQYVRIVLPNDAQIQAKNGLEIVDYGSKKGVEFFLDTRLQESSFYTVNYTLDNTECQPYDFMLYKQAGIKEYDISISIDGEKYDYRGREEDFYFEKRDTDSLAGTP